MLEAGYRRNEFGRRGRRARLLHTGRRLGRNIGSRGWWRRRSNRLGHGCRSYRWRGHRRGFGRRRIGRRACGQFWAGLEPAMPALGTAHGAAVHTDRTVGNDIARRTGGTGDDHDNGLSMARGGNNRTQGGKSPMRPFSTCIDAYRPAGPSREGLCPLRAIAKRPLRRHGREARRAWRAHDQTRERGSIFRP
jgi:hypothetical protein